MIGPLFQVNIPTWREADELKNIGKVIIKIIKTSGSK
jgi:hypothetical protein